MCNRYVIIVCEKKNYNALHKMGWHSALSEKKKIF